jgi:hypothetical protein
VNGAEFKCAREDLKLSPAWIAAHLGLRSERHVRRWEDEISDMGSGRGPLAVQTLKDFAEVAEDLARRHIQDCFAQAGVSSIEEYAKLEEQDWATIRMPRTDSPGKSLPASFYRAVAVTAAKKLSRRVKIVYDTEQRPGG